MPQTFRCTLVSPQRQLFEEPVRYASVPAWDGQIGIAPRRAPLLVKLGDGLLRLDLPDGTSRRFFLGGGFAQMKDNELAVLCDEAVAESELDRDHARTDLAAALRQKPHTDEEFAERDRRLGRARAMLHMAPRSEGRA